MAFQLRTVIPVWVVAAAGAIAIAVLSSPDQYFRWLPVVLVISILVTFALQIAIVDKNGLLDRVMASVSGAIVILGAATLVLGLISIA